MSNTVFFILIWEYGCPVFGRLCIFGFLAFLLAACGTTFDPAKVDCDEIAAARELIYAQYRTNMEQIDDAFYAAKHAARDRLSTCLEAIWSGTPCNEEWNALQEALVRVQADPTDDVLYAEYTQKRDTWLECNGDDFDSMYDEYLQGTEQQEQVCRERYDAELVDLEQKRAKALAEAEAERDRLLEELNKRQKDCHRNPKKVPDPIYPPDSDNPPDVPCCQSWFDGSHLPPVEEDFDPNPPRVNLPTDGERYTFPYVDDEAIFLLLFNFYHDEYYRLNPHENDIVVLSTPLIDLVRRGSEITATEQQVAQEAGVHAASIGDTLACGQGAEFHFAGSKLVVPDLEQPAFNLAFGRFRVYWDAQCTVEPKQCCADDDTCESGVCDRVFYSCHVDWTMYDRYDFDGFYKLAPTAWFGFDFHTVGTWDTSTPGSVRTCCEGQTDGGGSSSQSSEHQPPPGMEFEHVDPSKLCFDQNLQPVECE